MSEHARPKPMRGWPIELGAPDRPTDRVVNVEVIPTHYDVFTPAEFLDLGEQSCSYPEVSRCPVDKAA